ncbi:unnamed protein product [Urochloa humidicola]
MVTPAMTVASAGVAAVKASCAHYFSAVAATVAMMKAPGAGAALISKAAFLANAQLYFRPLGHAGVIAAAVGALCAYCFSAAAPSAVMMKAPGAGGALISKAAFLANPQLYFHLLRHAGVKAAIAAFAV